MVCTVISVRHFVLNMATVISFQKKCNLLHSFILEFSDIIPSIQETTGGFVLDLKFPDSAEDIPIEFRFNGSGGEMTFKFNLTSVDSDPTINNTVQERHRRQVMEIVSTLGSKLYEGIHSGHVSEFLNMVKTFFGTNTQKLAERTGHEAAHIEKNELTYDILRTMYLGDMQKSQKTIAIGQEKNNLIEEKELSYLATISHYDMYILSVLSFILGSICCGFLYVSCKYSSSRLE
jgi:cytochrome c biogenesis protein ResB